MRTVILWLMVLVPICALAAVPVHNVFGLWAALLFFVGCMFVGLFACSLCISAKQSDGEDTPL